MKYIDAEKLKAEIEKRIEETKSMKPSFDQFWAGQISAFKGCLKLIDSLQQEMELPDKYQTPDWIWEDKTTEQFAEEYVEGVKKCNDSPTWDLIHTAVCYGYELGRARKEDKQE